MTPSTSPIRRGSSSSSGSSRVTSSARSRAPSRARILLAADQRAFVCGHTGSGKTYLATGWVRGWSAGIAVDPKHTLTAAQLPGWETALGFRTALAHWPAHPRLIVRPLPGDLDPGGPYEELAELVIFSSRKGSSAGWYDDEVSNAAPLGRVNRGLERLIGEGREKAVPVVTATQRPVGVHNKVLSEVTHLVVFRLLLRGDRVKMAENAGDELLDPELLRERHSFAHFDATTGELTIHRPLGAE